MLCTHTFSIISRIPDQATNNKNQHSSSQRQISNKLHEEGTLSFPVASHTTEERRDKQEYEREFVNCHLGLVASEYRPSYQSHLSFRTKLVPNGHKTACKHFFCTFVNYIYASLWNKDAIRRRKIYFLIQD